MGRHHKRAPSSSDDSSGSESPPPSYSSDEAEKGRHHRDKKHHKSKRKHSSRDSRSESSGGSSSDEKRRHHHKRKSKRKKHAGGGGKYSDSDSSSSSDDEKSGLVHHRRRESGSSQTLIFVIIGIILLLCLCVGGYFGYKKFFADGADTEGTDSSGNEGGGASPGTGVGGSKSSPTGGGGGGSSNGVTGKDGTTTGATSAGSSKSKSSSSSGGASPTGGAGNTNGTAGTGGGNNTTSPPVTEGGGTTAPAPGGGENPPAQPSGKTIIAGYYPGYATDTLAVDKVPYKLYNHLYFFGTQPLKDGAFDYSHAGSADIAKQFVEQCKKNNVKAILCIGGMGEEVAAIFKSLTADDKAIDGWVEKIKKEVTDGGWAGVDLDWEYPKDEGEVKQITALATKLREALGKDAYISAATSFTTGNWGAVKDYSALAKVMSYQHIMTYDAHGPWSKESGPNTPIAAKCGGSGEVEIAAGIKSWVDAGFPANQIILGLAAYGHAFTIPEFAEKGMEGTTSPIYQKSGKPDPQPAQYKYGEIKAGGFIEGKDGWKNTFDECTQTPFLYNEGKKVLLPYDDPKSIEVKAAFAKTGGLAGCFVFDSAQDDAENSIVQAMVKACS